MNLNAREAFIKIFQKEELLSKFMEIDDVDEMYEFCLSVKGGYTKSQFVEFLFDLLGECTELMGDSGKTVLESEVLDAVSGGKGCVKRAVASTLAAASILSISGVNAAATEAENLNDGYISYGNADFRSIGKDNRSTKEKLKSGFSKVLGWAKENKGKVILGTVVAAAAFAGFVGGTAYLTDKVVKYSKEKDKYRLTRGDYDVKIEECKRRYDMLKGNRNGRIVNTDAAENILSQLDKFKRKRDGIGFLPSAKDKLKALGSAGAVAASGIGGVALLGGAVKSVFTTLATKTHEFGALSKDFRNIFTFYGDIGIMVDIIRGTIEGIKASAKFDEIGYDLDKRRDEFVSFLENEVIGQEKAKEKLKYVFDTTKYHRQLPEGFNLKQEKPIFILNGTAGIGKTMCANALARSLAPNSDKILEVSGPAFVEQIKNLTKLKDQLFSVESYGPFRFGKSTSNLGEYMMENPKGVIIINEYDKIGGDVVSEGAMKHPLDEILREFVDKRVIKNPKTNKDIDCSNIIIILTTNESNESLRLPKDPASENYTNTHPLHDGSFLDRCEIIPFKSFSESEYKQLSEKKLTDILSVFSSEFGGSYKFKLADKLHEKVAKYVYHADRMSSDPYAHIDEEGEDMFNRNTSARFVGGLVDTLTGKILSLNIERCSKIQARLAKDTGKSAKEIRKAVDPISGSKVDIDFDELKGEFVVTCSDYGNYSDSNYENLLAQLNEKSKK